MEEPASSTPGAWVQVARDEAREVGETVLWQQAEHAEWSHQLFFPWGCVCVDP